MRTLILIFLSFVFTNAAFAQAAELKSDDEIKSKLIGNTIAGSDNGNNYFEFLRQDGKIFGSDSSGRYEGEWRIKDSKMCFFYYKGEPTQDKLQSVAGDNTNQDQGSKQPEKEIDNEDNWDCSTVLLENNKITWKGDGDVTYSTLILGNPNGL